MTARIYTFICAILYVSIGLNTCFGIEAGEMVLLKKSGIGDTVIQAIEKEKIFETCALSVQDIITLKKSGFSDKEITAYIYHRSFLKNTTPIVYKNFDASQKITEMDIQDLAYLKEIGFSDDVIKAIIFQQTTADKNDDVYQTIKMFENMGMILDIGSKENDRNTPSKPR